jgi:hypothetical protein
LSLIIFIAPSARVSFEEKNIGDTNKMLFVLLQCMAVVVFEPGFFFLT